MNANDLARLLAAAAPDRVTAAVAMDRLRPLELGAPVPKQMPTRAAGSRHKATKQGRT
ncbi:MAG TPA: hypothetical protein PLE54_07555 [Burkholderiaceae bacterium]|nr:hypothetical protein [Burkholderiaceae bacterium]HQR70441.1 hypothetical protein [Burkholderiaceae bacterium]